MRGEWFSGVEFFPEGCRVFFIFVYRDADFVVDALICACYYVGLESSLST